MLPAGFSPWHRLPPQTARPNHSRGPEPPVASATSGVPPARRRTGPDPRPDSSGVSRMSSWTRGRARTPLPDTSTVMRRSERVPQPCPRPFQRVFLTFSSTSHRDQRVLLRPMAGVTPTSTTPRSLALARSLPSIASPRGTAGPHNTMSKASTIAASTDAAALPAYRMGRPALRRRKKKGRKKKGR